MANYIVTNSGLLNASILAHHGVKGMKWGVRRYQNKDGSLTPAGKKRYESMSGEEIYKQSKKQIHKMRKKQYGWSNQWMSRYGIGENSKRAIADANKAIDEFKNTPAYKTAYKKYEKAWRKLESEYGTSKTERLEKEYDKAAEELDMVSKPMRSMIGMKVGKSYVSDFVNGHGKNISIGYLKDMGFDDATAKRYVKEMAKTQKTLGMS